MWELLRRAPLLDAAIAHLLEVRRSLDLHLKDVGGRIRSAAAASAVCSRLMTVPGVGPMTALAYVTAIEEAHRFATSASVGAYLGLTPRRHQSADVDWSGHISKHGDGLARHMLYEAAHSLLGRVRAWSAPKAWAARLVKTVAPKTLSMSAFGLSWVLMLYFMTRDILFRSMGRVSSQSRPTTRFERVPCRIQ